MSPERLEFRRYRRTRAPLLVGFAFGALALLPLLSPGQVTVWRVLTSAVLLTSAIILIRATRPRATRVVLRLRDRVLERDGKSIPLGECSVQLCGKQDEDGRVPGATYRAELVLDDGRRELLLERTEPAGVLSDLVRVLEVLPLPVRSGWGLPSGAAPWEACMHAVERVSRPVDRAVPRYPAQRPSALTALVGGVITAVAMGIMMDTQAERGGSISNLSLALASGTVIIILLVGVFIATDRVRIRGDSELDIEHRALGIVWKHRRIARTALRHAWAVGPDPTEPHHLLLQLDDGLLAVRCAGEQARQLGLQLEA